MNIRLKSYLILLATFSFGITIGVLLAVATMKTTIHALGRDRMEFRGPPSFDRSMGPPGGGPGRMLERHLEAIVDPTEQQQARLHPLLKKYQERLGQVMKNHLEAVRSLMDSLDVDLKNILTPEQLEKWKSRPKPPHPPGGPDAPGGFRGPPPMGEGGPGEEPSPPRE